MPFTLLKNIITVLLICILCSGEYIFSQDSEYDSLFINEISPTNFQFTDEYGDLDDWIELYNAGTSAINIEGLYLTDELNNPLRWQIDISNLPDGMYFLSISIEEVEYIEKLIIAK